MKCPHCGKEITGTQMASAMAKRRDPETVLRVNRANAKKAGRTRIYPKTMVGRPRLYLLEDGYYELRYRGVRERHVRLASGIVSLRNPIIQRQAVKLVRKVERFTCKQPPDTSPAAPSP